MIGIGEGTMQRTENRRRFYSTALRAYVFICIFGGLLSTTAGQTPPPPAGPQPAPVRTAAPAETASTNSNTSGGTSTKPLIPTDPIQLFLAGGILMWPILLGSVIAVSVALERMIVLRRSRVIPRAFVDRFLTHLEDGKLDSEKALALCEKNGSPIALIFAHAVRKWGKPSVEVEQAVIDGGERQISVLKSRLRILNGIHTLSPLLGLLGTVFGMILSFNELAAGGSTGNAERLAGGIAVALLTTAAGLSVAIPTLVIYMYFVGRVDALVMEMDHLSQRVVHLISQEALESAQEDVQRKLAATKSSGGG